MLPLWILLSFVTGTVVVQSVPLTQTQLQNIADNLEIRVKVLDNLRHDLQYHIVRTSLSNMGSSAIPSTGWTLYFHSMLLVFPEVFPKNKTVDLEVEKVQIGMLQGDFYYMKPIDGFVAMQPGTSRDYDITVALWAVSRTDFMPYWYVTSDDDVNVVPVALNSTQLDLDYVDAFDDVRQWKRRRSDVHNPYTAQERMRKLGFRDTQHVSKLIIPTPTTVHASATGNTLTLDQSWKIYCMDDEFSSVAEYLKELIQVDLIQNGTVNNVTNAIIMTSSNTPLSNESYILNINAETKIILLESSDSDGMFYAVQSLRSILDGYRKQNIPTILVEDQPRFQYRGMHLDVARNFHTVDDVKRLLAAMAMYKMNRLHFHLSDDEGWRLEIPDLPELTQVGGNRCHDLTETRCIIPQFGSGPTNTTSGSGYYTVADYKDILRFAVKHHITVIPEFDTPGHAHSAITSMEARYRRLKDTNINAANEFRLADPDDTSEYISVQQWSDNVVSPCRNSTYAFIEQVMATVKDHHKDIQPLAIYNFGGDEVPGHVWENSTRCNEFLAQSSDYTVSHDLKRYFMDRVVQIAAKHGLDVGAWEEGFLDASHDPVPVSRLHGVQPYVVPWNSIWEWGGGNFAYKYANAGYKVILSPATNVYFDHPQEPDPEERGLYWATRFTDTKKVFKFMPGSLYDNIDTNTNGSPITKTDICREDMSKCVPLTQPDNVIGIQGALWSETVRTSADLDFMIFPRIVALAERAWHKAPFENSDLPQTQRDRLFELEWESFSKTLGEKEFERLEALGVEYRIPPPGARVLSNGTVEVSSTYPGLGVQYSTYDGTTWHEVTDSLTWNELRLLEQRPLYLRTTNAGRTRFSRTVELYKDEPIPWTEQSTLDYIAEYIDVKVDVIDNLNKTTFSDAAGRTSDFIDVSVTFTNKGQLTIPTGTWRIHFNGIYGSIDQDELSCGLKVGHVNIALYYFTPLPSFPGLQAGATLRCVYHHKKWSASRSDHFPNWFVTSRGMEPKLIQSTAGNDADFVGAFDTVNKWKRSLDDKYNPWTPADRFEHFKRGPSKEQRFRVVPMPRKLQRSNGTRTVFFEAQTWVVENSTDFPFESNFLAAEFSMEVRSSPMSNKKISVVKGFTPTGDAEGPEAYSLKVDATNEAITIHANTGQGALNGVQTLISLIRTTQGNLDDLEIVDSPRFSYRCIMLDVTRNFRSKEQVIKFLDIMSMYKLNKLHLHLSDDEAWRLEIPGIPELTQIASKRCHSDYTDDCVIPQLGSGPFSNNAGSGYYNITEYREILQHAADRHIEVIPEFDMPGHSVAAVAAMDEREKELDKLRNHGYGPMPESYLLYDRQDGGVRSRLLKRNRNVMNPCLTSTYKFVRKVVEATVQLHQDIQPLQTIHIGGDEVMRGSWDNSTYCNQLYGHTDTDTLQHMFVKKAAQEVAMAGLNLALWEDGVYPNGEPATISSIPTYKGDIYVYIWDNEWETDKAKRIAEFADAGYKVILPLATHLYFDHAQEPDPESRGLYWATRYIDTQKVFGLMPDDIYANADVDNMGNPADMNILCGNSSCPKTHSPENILGIQACLWSETMRTEHNLHAMAVPRLLALAERAWHKASWESMADADDRNSQRQADWESFADALGLNELPRLEDQLDVHYHVDPPGARVDDQNVLQLSTRYPNQRVEMSSDSGKTWHLQDPYRMIAGQHKLWLRTISPVLRRTSRPVALTVTIPGHDTSTASTYSGSSLTVTIVTVLCVLFYNAHLNILRRSVY